MGERFLNSWLLNLVVFIFCLNLYISLAKDFDDSVCNLSAKRKEQIQNYAPIIDKMKKAISGPFKNKTYYDLEDFIDTVGPRPYGSTGLEHAVEYLHQKLAKSDTGATSVRKEEVKSFTSTKGTESARIILPFRRKIEVLNEMKGRDTPMGGVIAKVLVITSPKEFQAHRNDMKGKIVLLTYSKPTGYLALEKIYSAAIVDVAKLGGKAVLIRSLTQFSLYNPHSFYFEYPNHREGQLDVPPIPVASITLEDAALLTRISRRGELIIMRLDISGYKIGPAKSYNVVGDYLGRTHPNDYIIISGHMDNVRVGLGAHDDGVGLLLSLNTLRLFKYLELQPKRTIRAIFWTGEEIGDIGVASFVKSHERELKDGRYRAALEVDNGCTGRIPKLFATQPVVFQCMLREILVSALKFKPEDSVIAVNPHGRGRLGSYSIPSVSLIEKPNVTFEAFDWFDHTEGDMMRAVEPDELDTCLLVYAATAFILSDATSEELQ